MQAGLSTRCKGGLGLGPGPHTKRPENADKGKINTQTPTSIHFFV